MHGDCTDTRAGCATSLVYFTVSYTVSWLYVSAYTPPSDAFAHAHTMPNIMPDIKIFFMGLPFFVFCLAILA